MSERMADYERKTAETQISCCVHLDGSGVAQVETGLPFLDHMIRSLARFSRIDIELRCKGDLEVDDHHTAEDCALALGTALDKALAERRGIARFGYAYAPLDEALARAVVDLSGRPGAVVNADLSRESIGTIACENIVHVFRSFARAGRFTLHLDVLRGDNDHHKAEAAFKALGLALRQAVAADGPDSVPSTKGILV